MILSRFNFIAMHRKRPYVIYWTEQINIKMALSHFNFSMNEKKASVSIVHTANTENQHSVNKMHIFYVVFKWECTFHTWFSKSSYFSTTYDILPISKCSFYFDCNICFHIQIITQ
jgi:hypothetical protein